METDHRPCYQQLIKKVRAARPKVARRPGMNGRSRTARPSANGAPASGMDSVDEEESLQEAPTEDEDSSVGGYETEESSSESEEDSSSSSSESSADETEELVDVDASGKQQQRMKPFIASVFDGKLASVVICDECKHGECSLPIQTAVRELNFVFM